MPQNHRDDNVNIGSGNGLVPSGNLSQCSPRFMLPYGVSNHS